MEIVTDKMLFKPTPMNLGFIVMGFDGDESKINTTLKSIDKWYSGVSCTVVLPEAHRHEYPGAKIGGKSVTSLINCGMAKPQAEWNVIVFAGVQIKEKLDQRYSTFLESRRDVFFPLVWNKCNFIDATMNGLTIHRDTFKEIGPFADDNPLEICKLMWYLNANDIGCKFKAIAGTRMC